MTRHYKPRERSHVVKEVLKSSCGGWSKGIRYLSFEAHPNPGNVEVKGLDPPLHLAIIVTAEEELRGFPLVTSIRQRSHPRRRFLTRPELLYFN